MKDIKMLFDKLGDAEYRHLILEPVMIYGVLIGVIAFLFAFLFKERKMQLGALMIIMVSSLCVVPYLKARSKSDKRAEKLFAANAELIEQQRETRKDAQWVYFMVAGLAGVTLLMGAHKGKPGLIVGIATIGAGAYLVLFSMAMHLKDAQIYHPNLRVAESEQGDKDKKKKDKSKTASEQRTPRETVRLAQRSANAP
jgi:hypothetical protein